ncbi:hypothetical protein AK812_SmicGene45958, partial [Symbiodinium microadriaticum]
AVSVEMLAAAHSAAWFIRECVILLLLFIWIANSLCWGAPDCSYEVAKDLEKCRKVQKLFEKLGHQPSEKEAYQAAWDLRLLYSFALKRSRDKGVRKLFRMLQQARNELADQGEAEPENIQAPDAGEAAPDDAVELEGAWEDEWFSEGGESEDGEDYDEDDEMSAVAEPSHLEEAGGGNPDASMDVGGHADAAPEPARAHREPATDDEGEEKLDDKPALPRTATDVSYRTSATVDLEKQQELDALMAQIRELELKQSSAENSDDPLLKEKLDKPDGKSDRLSTGSTTTGPSAPPSVDTQPWATPIVREVPAPDEAPASAPEKEIETPDRSRNDDFEGVSPADQKKLKSSLCGTAKRGRRKGQKLKRMRSMSKARSRRTLEPVEEEEEKFELPKLPKKPRTKICGDGPEPEEFCELPSTTRAREAREAKAKAKAKGKPGRPRRDESAIPDGPVTFQTDENGLVMGCSSCRFSWWGCATCKNPSFKGKRRDLVTWVDIFNAKQSLKGSKPKAPNPDEAEPVKTKATAKGKPKASAKTAPKAKASPKAKAKGKAKAKATAKAAAKGKAIAVAKSSSSKSKKVKHAESEDESEAGDDWEEVLYEQSIHSEIQDRPSHSAIPVKLVLLVIAVLLAFNSRIANFTQA